jgi:hypothetical protein
VGDRARSDAHYKNIDDNIKELRRAVRKMLVRAWDCGAPYAHQGKDFSSNNLFISVSYAALLK